MYDTISRKIKRKDAWTDSFDIAVITQIYMLESRIPAAFQNHTIWPDLNVAEK